MSQQMAAHQASTDRQFKVRVIVIDAVKRSVRQLMIKRDRRELERLLLQGDTQVGMQHYRSTRLENNDKIFYLCATAYWCGCLQREHGYFFKIKGVGEPFAWRAIIVSDGDVATDVSEIKGAVQFIDATSARTLTDAALGRVELIASVATGREVKRWRPWDLAED
jgi:hypothetical protein